MNLFPNLIVLSVVAASVLGVAMLIPQALTISRRGDFSGVSPSWIGGGLAINLGWIGYSLAADLPGLLPVAMGATVLYGWMASMVRSTSRAMFAKAMVGAATLGALFAIAAFVGGVAGVGIVVASLYAGQFAPAAWSAVTSTDVSGISLLTWVLASAEAGLWAFYGSYQGDLNLVVGGVGAILMSAVVIIAVLRARNPRHVHDVVVAPS